MKLRFHTVVAFLAVGAACNLLSAWVFELWSTTECVDLAARPVPVQRPATVEGTWVAADKVQFAEGFGRSTIWYLRGDEDVCLHRAGWPFRSLQYQYDEPPRGGIATGVYRYAVHTPKWAFLPPSLKDKILPARPLFAGFIANTVIWAAALLPPVYWAGLAARRMRRSAKGLCPACRYPIGVSEVCTECGARLPSRTPPATDAGLSSS